MSHQPGYGMLIITSDGQTRARWAIMEGSELISDIDGRQFAFVLQKAPGLNGYDIREMSSEAIAKFLASKLEGEALQAEIDAGEYPEE